jgi:hypothetical protein
MEDLARFFRQIVSNLAGTENARLHRPLPLGEIRQTILPYRANRRALQLESSEDYEFVLIRFCAGEGGFARIEPADVHAKFAAEVLSANPDLTIGQRYEDATVILNEEQVTRALDPEPEIAFAPPDQRYPPRAPAAPPSPPAQPTGPSPAICRACGGKLPRGRNAKFCPHCGESQTLDHCPECQTALEPGWRHCVNCGANLQRE